MDIKHLLAQNPLKPAYPTAAAPKGDARPLGWREFEGGLVEIGHDGAGFAFDNEGPRHRVWLDPFALATRPGDLRRISGLHRRRRLPPAGVLAVGRLGLRRAARTGRRRFTGRSMEAAGSFHASRPEAASIRPSRCATSAPTRRRPTPSGPASACRARRSGKPARAPWTDIGEVWEWTASPMSPTPAIASRPGAIGEYNGKFMANQMVLRGGCAATPRRPYPHDLSQLLSAGRALDVRRSSSGGGSAMNGPALGPRASPRRTTARNSGTRCWRGSRARPRAIPAKFLYDARGSALFDQICELPEYYLTRTETAILRQCVGEIAVLAGPGCALVEFGSGSSVKSRLLLEGLARSGGLRADRHLAPASRCHGGQAAPRLSGPEGRAGLRRLHGAHRAAGRS